MGRYIARHKPDNHAGNHTKEDPNPRNNEGIGPNKLSNQITNPYAHDNPSNTSHLTNNQGFNQELLPDFIRCGSQMTSSGQFHAFAQSLKPT